MPVNKNRKWLVYLIASVFVLGVIVVVFANAHKVEIVPAPERAPTSSSPDSQNIQSDIKDILVQVRPCVVSVISYTGTILDQVGQTNTKLLDPYKKGNKTISSGIIINPDGVILTTRDSIPSSQIEIELFRRKPNVFNADIIEINDNLDLALLQIKNAGNLSHCSLGDSSAIEIGNIVFAIGSPYGFSETVTSGIVSNSRKNIRIEGKFFKNLIQTDAIINDGNSGGPLVDVNGLVVGINVAVLSEGTVYSGIGFAIPINDAKDFIGRMLP